MAGKKESNLDRDLRSLLIKIYSHAHNLGKPLDKVPINEHSDWVSTSQVSLRDGINSLKNKDLLIIEHHDRVVWIRLTSKGEKTAKEIIRKKRAKPKNGIAKNIGMIILGSLGTVVLGILWQTLGFSLSSLPLRPIVYTADDAIVIENVTVPVYKNIYILKDEVIPESLKVSKEVWYGGVNNPLFSSFLETNTSPCPRNDKKCRLIIDFGDISASKSLGFEMKHKYNDDNPISIQGLRVRFADYKELPDHPVNFLHLVPKTSGIPPTGTEPPQEYYLANLPGFEENQGEISISDIPSKLHSEVDLKPACQPIEQSCQYGALTKDDLKQVELSLPFIEKLPPGWYSFEVAILYSYNGERITKDKITFEIMKPNNIRFWKPIEDQNHDGWLRSFSTINLDTGLETIDQPNFIPITSQPGKTLLVRASNGPLYNDYFVDLATGKISQNVSYSYYEGDILSLGVTNAKYRSPDGFRVITEIMNKDRNYWNVDLGIVDERNGKFTYVEKSPTTRELFPVWSPDTKRIAYVRYGMEQVADERIFTGDVFIYDIDSGKNTKITQNSDQLETDLVWLDQGHLLVYYRPVVYFDDFLSVQNTRSGVFLIDIETGREIELPVSSYGRDYVKYLPMKNAFAIHNLLFDLEGRPINTINTGGRSCYILDTPGDLFSCVELVDDRKYRVFYANDDPSKPLGSIGFSSKIYGKVYGKRYNHGSIYFDTNKKIIEHYSEEGLLIEEIDVSALSWLFDFNYSEIALIIQ